MLNVEDLSVLLCRALDKLCSEQHPTQEDEEYYWCQYTEDFVKSTLYKLVGVVISESVIIGRPLTINSGGFVNLIV